MDYYWDDLYFQSEYGSSINFYITINGGIAFYNSSRILFYDESWNLVNEYEPDETIMTSSVKQDNDGNFYYLDHYNNCYVLSPTGDLENEFELIDDNGQRIDDYSKFEVTPTGNLVFINTEGGYFGWSIDK